MCRSAEPLLKGSPEAWCSIPNPSVFLPFCTRNLPLLAVDALASAEYPTLFPAP